MKYSISEKVSVLSNKKSKMNDQMSVQVHQDYFNQRDKTNAILIYRKGLKNSISVTVRVINSK